MVRAATYDVREFGATGDGVAKDTAAVQKAIDAAHGAGGGTVRLGAGTYLTGSLFLKSNVDLFLDHGATLKGSADRADYNAPDVCPQNSVCSNESSFGAHLLLCIEQTNVTVRGTGRIDGSSGAFIAGPDGRNWPGGQRGILWRPSQMLYFVECDGVRVEGVSLIDVHCYAGSENMGAIARQLKARGRLHQAFVTSGLKDIELARKAVPEVVANNIERPGPRNRDWTPEENATFVHDAIAHQCRYLQLSRPWPRSYSDDAHAGDVKVILFHSDDPASVQDLMAVRGIDFVMTNRLSPMTEAFRELNLSLYGE